MTERPSVPEIAARHLQANAPTAWFEELYARAQKNPDFIPWADLAPNPNLVEWQTREQRHADGQPALVVGCGLGDDAEYVAKLGYRVTAFDVSQSAIEWCKERWPSSPVAYHTADLFHLPQAWEGAFDFVMESYTVQALPLDVRARALTALSKTLRPGGEMLLICRGREDDQTVGTNPPWPISRAELQTLEDVGLTVVKFEDFVDNAGRHVDMNVRRFRVLYRK